MYKNSKKYNTTECNKAHKSQQEWSQLLHDINKVRNRLVRFTQQQIKAQRKKLSELKQYNNDCSCRLNQHTSCDMNRNRFSYEQRCDNKIVIAGEKFLEICNLRNDNKKQQWEIYLQNLQLMNSNLLRQKHMLQCKLQKLEKQKNEMETYFNQQNNQYKGTLQYKKKQRKAKFADKKDHIYTDFLPQRYHFLENNKKQYKTIDNSIQIKVKPIKQTMYINHTPTKLTTTQRYSQCQPSNNYMKISKPNKQKKYKRSNNKVQKSKVMESNAEMKRDFRQIMNSNKTTIVNMDGISSRFYQGYAEDVESKITNNYHRIDSNRKKKDRFSPRITFSRDGKLNYSSLQNPNKNLQTKCTPKNKKMTASLKDSKSEQRKIIDEKVQQQKLRMMSKYFERLVGFCKQQTNLQKKRILRQEMSELAMQMSDLREKISAANVESRTYEQFSNTLFDIKEKKEFSF